MNEKTVGKQKSERTVSKYAEISGRVWNVFKNYLPNEADLGTFTQDIHELDQYLHDLNDIDLYRFGQKLMKAYFDELRDIKG